VTAYAIEILPLDQLRPWTRNARTHSRKQIRQIAESIRRFGFTNPVLIDGENRILAGHGRVEAARELGMATAPCLRIDHMSATDKRAYVLADNKLALNAGWDEELLALELKELMEADIDFGVDITGTLPWFLIELKTIERFTLVRLPVVAAAPRSAAGRRANKVLGMATYMPNL
jgi:ParB-like nuclease domain